MTEPKEKISQIDRGTMRRVLGVFDVFAIGYGDMGSSIYYALGITAFFALGATPLALLAAGFVFICTALTYAEMTSVFLESGGSATYTRKAFNDFVSFIAGWGLLLDFIVTIAISSFAIAPYLSYFVPVLMHADYKVVFSCCMIFGLLLLNIRGVKESTRASLILTSITILTQLVIIVFAIFTVVNFKTFYVHLKIGGANTLWSPSWEHFLHGIAMAMVAYTGIESMAQLSSEAKDPSKTIPRAIMLAMVFLIVAYLGISLVALSVLTPHQLSTTYLDDPISGIVEHLPGMGAILAPWIGILAAVILLVAANAGLIGSSRLAFNMGEYFQLPKFFYKLHKTRQTPYVSLSFFAICAMLILVASRGKLAFLADLYNFGAMLAFFCAHTSLIVHRVRFPDIERPFRIKGNIPFGKARIPITAIIGAIATLSVWILVVLTKPYGRTLGFAWVGIGLAMYYFYRRGQKISPFASLEIEKIKISELNEVKIESVLIPTRGHLGAETIQVGCQIAKMYNAKVSVVHIIEVPITVPLSTPLGKVEKYSSEVLKKAEAIAMDVGVEITMKSIHARSPVKAIKELTESEKYDLVILGAVVNKAISPLAQHLMRGLTGARVWIIGSNIPSITRVATENI
ncbi:MAG: Putrescine transporter PotE [Chlamydiia bacterium]|nr:Putrescine transporter PotE [Chlamydiia bacterium]